MQVSYNILKNFVKPPRDYSARELADILTMSTVEVDDYHNQAETLQGVVVGLVTEVKPHPQADKLKLAVVDIGDKSIEVVCGGVNLREGMKVSLAQVGTRVKWHGQGDWVTLEKATIRGIESSGMICAAEELGLPDPEAVEHGIMDLSHLKVKVGTPLAEALKLDDIILDIDNKSITHRPDLWGHLGVARELSAIWNTKFKSPKIPEIKSDIDVPLMVTVKKSAQVTRYMAVALGNMKVAPSPAWLQQALNNLGMRPINNIVDITNYVMLELGQPLHAFDLDKLSEPEIVVRQAEGGENFVTLDGVGHKLDESMLLIADTKEAQAIAGVMGGQTSEVGDNTTNIVLESATFDPINIRATAAKLGLRTEASARFEKSLDPVLAEMALKRAVELFIELIPGARVVSPVVDVFSGNKEIPSIKLKLPWLYARLGTEIPKKEVKDILERLGFEVKAHKEEFEVTPPSWRATRDISIPEDLVEEIARIYGYGRIPLSLPKLTLTQPAKDDEQTRRWDIRDFLTTHGFAETLTYSFVGQRVLSEVSQAVYSALNLSCESLFELENPVNQAESQLRPALVPRVVSQVIINALHLPHQPVQLFELGRVFTPKASTWATGRNQAMLPAQPWHLVVAVRLPGNDWAETYQRLRGALESLVDTLGFKIIVEPMNQNTAKILIDGKHAGGIAVVQFMKSSLKPVVAMAEINLEMFPMSQKKVTVHT